MTLAIDMRVLELISARLCHELISPVAAIGNGVELLSEDDPEFVRDAVALIGDSAQKAAMRLQFYRFAFGFGSGAGLAGPPPHTLVSGLFEGTRIRCDYDESLRALSLEWQKLACNLALAGAEALPHGGQVALRAGAAGPLLEASGDGAAPAAELNAAFGLAANPVELTSRTVIPYLAGLLARALGRRLAIEAARPGRFIVRAVPAA